MARRRSSLTHENTPDSDLIPTTPEVEHVKYVLFYLVGFLLLAFIVVMLVFSDPGNPVVISRHPNGYPATETEKVMDALGKNPVAHGRHRAWHMNRQKSEEGSYDMGQRVGPWQFWDERGELDVQRSGHYEKGVRVRPWTANE